MKVNELRVGNYVLDNFFGGVLKIKGISEESNLFYIRGILLTEEWLLKFGFKKTEWDNSNSYLFVTPGCDYSIVVYSNGYLEIGGMVMRKIDYVHQLQNFVFALSGVELTIIDNKC
jgi:hypothetical protein